MEKADRDNLQFILNTNGEALVSWYSNLSMEEKKYATRLLDVYREELYYKAVLVSDEPVTDLTEARAVLSYFI